MLSNGDRIAIKAFDRLSALTIPEALMSRDSVSRIDVFTGEVGSHSYKYNNLIMLHNSAI